MTYFPLRDHIPRGSLTLSDLDIAPPYADRVRIFVGQREVDGFVGGA